MPATRLLIPFAILLAGHGARAQLCTVGATALTLGVYDPGSPAASDIAGTVTVGCRTVTPASVSYAIQLTAGSSGSVAARSLSGTAGRLAYNVYTDNAHSIIWGDDTAGSAAVRDAYGLGLAGSVNRSYTAYGRIPAGQRIAPGLYADTLTVIIIY